MTSRERILSALNHKEPDRTPYFEYVLLNPVAETLLGGKYVDYAGDIGCWHDMVMEIGWEQALRKYASDRIELAYILKHDMLYVVPNPVAEDTIERYHGENDKTDVQSDDPVEHIVRSNQENERNLLNLPLSPLDDRFLVYSFIREEMDKLGIDLPILAPACGHGVWTNVDLMQTMILEPEVAHKHFALATAYGIKITENLLDSGVEQIMVGGDFSGNNPIISPDTYRTFIVPEVRKQSRFIHEAVGYSINASDGNLWPVIDDYLAGCEVDGCIEIDMHAGMDLDKLKKLYGDRFTFYGNMDCGNILSFSTQDKIEEYTIKCIDNGWGNGGHIFCASNAISESISLKNYIAMVDAYRGYFGLPKLEL